MLLRIRSRDGLERVQIKEEATVKELMQVIEQTLEIPTEKQILSTDVTLLTAKEADVGSVKRLSNPSKKLSALGIKHGSMLYLKYGYERDVPAATTKSAFESKPFGASMTVEQMIAKQTRIERQEKPNCSSVSLERNAANAFQLYINQGIAFTIKRGAYMYGYVDEEKGVMVECIYEPPQDGTQDELLMHVNEEEESKVESLTSMLGLKKVGMIFSQSAKEKDYLVSTDEIMQMARMQHEHGELFVTAIVSMFHSDEGADIHFEAYQCSNQCVKLLEEGWFMEEGKHTGISHLKNPKEPENEKPVIVVGKDTSKVDNEWFLCPVKIQDHQGILSSDFAIENRLTAQGTNELKEYLKKNANSPFVRTLSNFHLLLYLSKHSNMDANDIAMLAQAVKDQSDVGEGYKIIIESIAHM